MGEFENLTDEQIEKFASRLEAIVQAYRPHNYGPPWRTNHYAAIFNEIYHLGQLSRITRQSRVIDQQLRHILGDC